MTRPASLPGGQKPDARIVLAFRHPLVPVAGWLLAGDAGGAKQTPNHGQGCPWLAGAARGACVAGQGRSPQRSASPWIAGAPHHHAHARHHTGALLHARHPGSARRPVPRPPFHFPGRCRPGLQPAGNHRAGLAAAPRCRRPVANNGRIHPTQAGPGGGVCLAVSPKTRCRMALALEMKRPCHPSPAATFPICGGGWCA